MIFLGPHVYNIKASPLKRMYFELADEEEMGPYRTNGDKLSFSPAVSSCYREEVLQELLSVTKRIFNEAYYMPDKELRQLEILARHYEFPNLMAWFERNRENPINMPSDMIISLETQNRPHTEDRNNKLIRDFKEEMMLSDDAEQLRSAKISYLQAENVTLMSQIQDIEQQIARMQDQDCESWIIDMIKTVRKYDSLRKKHSSNLVRIKHTQGEYKNIKNGVTDEMIAEAKKVPFDKILKLEQIGARKRCKCPFHNEKTASFYVYPDTNRGYCHGCGKSADTIQYLVEIEGMEFSEAVRALLAY